MLIRVQGETMKEYIKRFKTSYEEARKLKEEIYALNKTDDAKDIIWEEIVYICLKNKSAKWYFE